MTQKTAGVKVINEYKVNNINNIYDNLYGAVTRHTATRALHKQLKLILKIHGNHNMLHFSSPTISTHCTQQPVQRSRLEPILCVRQDQGSNQLPTTSHDECTQTR